MLRVLEEAEFDKYIDFAYNLALDLTKSSYPTYTDGIKTKEDFIARAKVSFRKESEEIMLFEVDGSVEGWIHYYVLKEDENYVDVIFFKNYDYLSEATGLVKVTKDNFDEFAEIHKAHDEDMYWNNERIWKAFEEWDMYLLYEEGQAVGAILYCFIENMMMEIFSVDFKDNQYDAAIFRVLLIKALNEGKKSGISSLTFFNEEDGHSVVQELGFTHISKYVLYTRTI